MKRGGKLKRKTPLVRSKRLNKVNRKRKAKLFRRNYGSSERLTWLKAGGCEVARRWANPRTVPLRFLIEGPERECSVLLDAAHAVPRGMGGVRGDADDLVCLCRNHHRRSGELGTTERAEFERRYEIDLVALAAKRAAEWAAYKGGK